VEFEWWLKLYGETDWPRRHGGHRETTPLSSGQKRKERVKGRGGKIGWEGRSMERHKSFPQTMRYYTVQFIVRQQTNSKEEGPKEPGGAGTPGEKPHGEMIGEE